MTVFRIEPGLVCIYTSLIRGNGKMRRPCAVRDVGVMDGRSGPLEAMKP